MFGSDFRIIGTVERKLMWDPWIQILTLRLGSGGTLKKRHNCRGSVYLSFKSIHRKDYVDVGDTRARKGSYVSHNASEKRAVRTIYSIISLFNWGNEYIYPTETTSEKVAHRMGENI